MLLRVDGIPAGHAREGEVAAIFSRFGKIDKVALRRDEASDQRWALVTFHDDSAARLALLANAPVLGGSQLSVNEVKLGRNLQRASNTSLDRWVGDIVKDHQFAKRWRDITTHSGQEKQNGQLEPEPQPETQELQQDRDQAIVERSVYKKTSYRQKLDAVFGFKPSGLDVEAVSPAPASGRLGTLYMIP
jgi:hypothetical protein